MDLIGMAYHEEVSGDLRRRHDRGHGANALVVAW